MKEEAGLHGFFFQSVENPPRRCSAPRNTSAKFADESKSAQHNRDHAEDLTNRYRGTGDAENAVGPEQQPADDDQKRER
jgi:hypothetical protein